MRALQLGQNDVEKVRDEIVLKNSDALMQRADFARAFEAKAQNELLERGEVRRGLQCLEWMRTFADDVEAKASPELWSQVRELFATTPVAQTRAADSADVLRRLRERKHEITTLLGRALNRRTTPRDRPLEKIPARPLDPDLEVLSSDWGDVHEMMYRDAACALQFVPPDELRPRNAKSAHVSTTTSGRVNKIVYVHAARPIDFEEIHFVAPRPETLEERDSLLGQFASDFLVGSMLAHALGLAALAPNVVACGFVALGRDEPVYRPQLQSPALSGDSPCLLDAQCVARPCALTGEAIVSAADARCVRGLCYSRRALAHQCKRPLLYASAPGPDEDDEQDRLAELLAAADPSQEQQFLRTLASDARPDETAAGAVLRLLGLAALAKPRRQALERQYGDAKDQQSAHEFLRAARAAYTDELAPARAAELRRSGLHRALRSLPAPSSLVPPEEAYRALRGSVAADVGALFRPWAEVQRSTPEGTRESMAQEAQRVQNQLAEDTWRDLLADAEWARGGGAPPGLLNARLPASLLLLLGDARPRAQDVEIVRTALQDFARDGRTRALLGRILLSLKDAYKHGRLPPGSQRQEPEGLHRGLLWDSQEIQRFRSTNWRWEFRPVPAELRKICRLPNGAILAHDDLDDAAGAAAEAKMPTLELRAWRAVSASARIVLLEHVFLQMFRTGPPSSASPGELAHAAARTVFRLAAAGVAFPALRITDFCWNGRRADFAGPDLKPCFRGGEPGPAWRSLAALCMLDILVFTTYTAWRLAITRLVLESGGAPLRGTGDVAEQVRRNVSSRLHQRRPDALLSSKLAADFRAAAMKDLWATTAEPGLSANTAASLEDSTFFTVLGQHVFDLWSARGGEIARHVADGGGAELLRAHERARDAALGAWKQQMTLLVAQMPEGASQAWILPLDTDTAIRPRWSPPDAQHEVVTFEAKLLSAPKALRALLRRTALVPGDLRPTTVILRPHLRYKAWPARAPVDLGLEALVASGAAFFAPSSPLVSSMLRHRRLPDSFCPTPAWQLWAPCTPGRCPPAFRWNDTLPWSCGAIKGTRVCRGPLWALSSLITFLPTTEGLVSYIYDRLGALPEATSWPPLLLPDRLSGLRPGVRRLFVAQNALLDALALLHIATGAQGEPDKGADEEADEEASGFLARRAAQLERMAHARSARSVAAPAAVGGPDAIAPLCAHAAHAYAEAKDALLGGARALAADDETARNLYVLFEQPRLLHVDVPSADLLTLAAGQLFGPSWQRLH